MKLLFKEHNYLLYEFRWFASTQRIEVAKAGEWMYSLTRLRSGYFSCNCPGGTYRGKCWHQDEVENLFTQPDITEPWGQWNEEYEVNQQLIK